MKLTDLKDLRFIKKSLEPQPEQKPLQNQPRKCSVVLKSREEEHARNEGLTMGQKVRMMDTNDTATITGFGKDYYELELDGLTIRAVRSEFIPIDAEEDRRLRNAIPSRSHKTAKEVPVFEDNTGDLTVDLHIERIPGSEGVPEWAALDFQMNYFRQLDEVFALSCTYTYSTPGITNVTIR